MQQLERTVRSAGLKLSQRLTRRSLIGRSGGALVALGAAGYTLVPSPEPAGAVCDGGLSDTCNSLLGYNHCPDYTCSNGYWHVSGGPCGGGGTYWQDCCVSASGCPGGCHCHNNHPTCCYSCYPSGGGYCVNCCGVNRCRRWFC
jgi:hypothetical protein